MIVRLQTKGMTLEDISVLFGDPVELSFEQAMKGEKEAEPAVIQPFDDVGEVEMTDHKPQTGGQHVERV